MIEIVDTHVHLYFPDFDEDRDGMIARAKDCGVKTFINVGTDVASSKQCLAMAEAHDFVFASAGIHPHEAKDADAAAMKAIEELLPHPKMVAIGEVGLDFYREHSPHDKQKEVLAQFFAMYKKIQKPLIIHCRDAYEAMLDLLKAELDGPVKGIMHCYSSDAEDMKKFLDWGFLISFAGPLTYKKNNALREACRQCPEDRIVFETDAPFLPPQSKRGKRNESAYMVETLKTAAQVRGTTLEALSQVSTQNAKRLFRL